MSETSQTWLLDTNILSHIIKRPHDSAARRVRQIAESTDSVTPRNTPAGRLITSVIVECELAFGAQRAGSITLTRKIADLLHFIQPAPLTNAIAGHYANIRTRLEQSGKPIGPNDLLIAAHALALDATLVTDNEDEFRRVPGLRVENWLREAL